MDIQQLGLNSGTDPVQRNVSDSTTTTTTTKLNIFEKDTPGTVLASYWLLPQVAIVWRPYNLRVY